MRFLADVHIANRISLALTDAGHEVVRAALQYPTATDEELLALAVRDGLTIVTEDSDFSELVYAFGMAPPPAIIYIRAEPEDQPAMADRVLETIASGRLDNCLAVIRRNTTRFRPFPEKRKLDD